MKDTLIVYYTRTGNSKVVGEYLKEKLHCDCEEVKDLKDRSGAIGFIGAGIEAAKKATPPIQDTNYNVSEYEKVVVVTPIWAGTMASPMRSYLAKNISDIKKLCVISNLKGANTRIKEDIEKNLKKQIEWECMVKESEIKSGDFKAKVEQLF